MIQIYSNSVQPTELHISTKAENPYQVHIARQRGIRSLQSSQAGTEQSVIARTQSGTVLKTDGWHPRGNYPKPHNPKEPPKNHLSGVHSQF